MQSGLLISLVETARVILPNRKLDVFGHELAANREKGFRARPRRVDTKGRKITVNEAEAERVRTIFRSYLKLGSLNLLMVELRKQPLT